MVYAARTHGELERLVEDVSPAPATLPVRPGDDEGTRWAVSIIGGGDRKGRWRVGRRCTVVNVMGGNDVTLGKPAAGGPRLRLRIVSIMGGTNVRRGRKLSRRERKRLHS